MSLVIWVFVYSLLLLGLRGAMGRMTGARLVKILFFPGVVAALLIRLPTCWLSSAPVREVNPPWRSGAPIVYGRPKVAFYGPLMFAIFPFAAGAVLLLAIAQALEFPVWFDVQLPSVQPDMKDLSLLLRTSGEILQAAVRSIETLHPADPRLWLFIYAAASLHLFVAPQVNEWRPLAIVLGILGTILGVCDWLGLRARFMSRAWYIQTFYGDRVWDGLSLLVAMALLGLICGVLVGGGAMLVRASGSRYRREK